MGEHGKYRALVTAAAVLAASGAPAPAGAACRLALALGMDVSRSVSPRDYTFQQGGLIEALKSADIRAAFLTPEGDVMLAVFEWSGPDAQDMVMDWHNVGSEADLDEILALMTAHIRSPARQTTALGAALDYGRTLLSQRTDCAARTLDMSGDGRNNTGPAPQRIYAQVDFGDITVNGVTIASHEADIADYYRSNVIRGDGSFVEVAQYIEDYPKAIHRKLLRELTQGIVGDAGPVGRRG